jgi:hypothetical protein
MPLHPADVVASDVHVHPRTEEFIRAMGSGAPGVLNDTIAQAVMNHPDVFIGFGVVEPQLGELARVGG